MAGNHQKASGNKRESLLGKPLISIYCFFSPSTRDAIDYRGKDLLINWSGESSAIVRYCCRIECVERRFSRATARRNVTTPFLSKRGMGWDRAGGKRDPLRKGRVASAPDESSSERSSLGDQQAAPGGNERINLPAPHSSVPFFFFFFTFYYI